MPNSDKKLLCKLDKSSRIYCDGEKFTLEHDSKEGTKKYYYGWIGDALRGYILISLSNLSKIEPSVNDLINRVETLFNTVKSVDITFTDRWRSAATDPIECACSQASTDKVDSHE
jgi:hypothetical protein